MKEHKMTEQNQARHLILNNITDVEASIDVLLGLDTLIFETVTATTDAWISKNKWQWCNEESEVSNEIDDLGDDSQCFGLKSWINKDDEIECHFVFNVGEKDAYGYAASDQYKSLAARLLTPSKSRGEFGLWWLLNGKPKKTNDFLSENLGKANIHHNFRFADYSSNKPHFGLFLPISFEGAIDSLDAANVEVQLEELIASKTQEVLAIALEASTELTKLNKQFQRL
jgi:hypothetical protein